MRYSRAELEACWSRIRAPHLLLYGEQSGHSRRVLGSERPTQLQEVMPSLRIELISAAGHLMPYEQPEQVARAIRQFAAAQGEGRLRGPASTSVLPLRRRDAACFVIGRCSATLAGQMLAVAVGWQVDALTRDPLALGLVGLSEFLPFILLVLIGGHAADHAARRAIVCCAYSGQILCAFALLLMSLHRGPPSG